MEKYEFSAYIEKPSFRYESEHRERGEEKLTEEEEEEEETQMTKKRPNRRREKPFQSPSNHIETGHDKIKPTKKHDYFLFPKKEGPIDDLANSPSFH